MLAGLQGAGKTTLAGKLALWLKGQGHTPLLVASDLQRPNAVQQLQIVGEQAGVPVWAPGTRQRRSAIRSRSPASGIEHAQVRLHDIVIVDTAGRLGVDAEMMQQAVDIRDAVNPNEILFVVDAMIGQDAVTTAEAFRDGVGFTGVVLTKLDGDARGGAALSVRHVTGQPIMFASTGEKLADFDIFHPDRMASRILGHGRHAHPDRAGRAALRGRPGRGDGRQDGRRRLHPRRLPAADDDDPQDGPDRRTCWACCPAPAR